MKRFSLFVVALPLVLAACGKDASDKPASTSTAPAVTATAPASAAPVATAPIAITPAPTQPTPPPAPPLAAGDAIDYATVAQARAVLSQRTDVQSREDDGWLIVADAGAGAFWSFTPPDHAANPAVVKRTIHEKAGVVSVAMATLCEAPKPACADLTRQFEDINERMRADLQHQADKHKK
ncbi:MAG TPA: hypothetical protein VIE67_02220 [Rudaea sp.]|uniref:hypothetical protein n=1 Tax=Rudaea sp. TaxID=2136325 RepID=UPI002F952031